jgi:hypothetical protein
LVKDGAYRSIELAKVDGQPVRETSLADPLRAAGFIDGYRGLVYRSRAFGSSKDP